MRKVININFQGRILPIEEQAYELLKQYIESLRVYFSKEEGRDEIINDIECRIAELCEEKLKKGEVCIEELTINSIIASIGRPEDFDAENAFESNTQTNESTNNSSNSWSSATTQKRLYRDEQNKVLGGVCSGIANYFGMDPLLVRILWFFLVGINFVVYIILWIAVPSSSVKEVGGVRKRLFRDIDNKVIGGVAAGLSKYFGIKVWIIRVLFLIPFIRFIFNFRHFHLFQFWDAPDFPNFLDITFSPGAVFVYIVLWLVLPEAKTSADKLEMVGEKVDINSIKNTIQNDMEGFSKRAQSWGAEFYKSKNANAAHAPETNRPLEAQKGCLYYFGRILTIGIKAIVYFILAIVALALLVSLFGVGVAATALLPLRKFILEDGIQTMSAVGAIIFFVWVPVIAIVVAIIRKIAGYKRSNKWVRTSFIALWVLGWVFVFYFFSSLGNSFSKHNIPEEQSIALTNPTVDFMQITAAPKMKYYENQWLDFEPFNGITEEDSVFVRNLRIRIVQSKTDSFEVKLVKLSNGKTVDNANYLANKINFALTQQDSVLYLDRGIAINKNDKFRNQHIIMTIAVPIGKRIKITNKGWSQTNVRINRRGMRSETIDRISSDDNWYDEWSEPWDNESFPYEKGVEYKMTSTGLEKIRRDEPASHYEEQYDQESPSEMESRLEELRKEREALENNLQKSKDALQKDKEELQKENKSIQKVALSISESNIPLKGAVWNELQWIIERFTY